jgi:hypothetical protein
VWLVKRKQKTKKVKVRQAISFYLSPCAAAAALENYLVFGHQLLI